MENKGVWIERARTELGVWGRGEGVILKKSKY
jgi:hypothetical protein